MNKGRSVRLYLADGTSSGIVTAEIMNWTGHILSAPRTRLESALAREELGRTGVYFLLGPDDSGSDLIKVYIGETDEIGKRIYSHNKDEQKAFWERFIAVTSKDLNLTKAHVRYLESRILEMAVTAKKCKIANKDIPKFDKLPEADIADMESFITEIELALPVIGVEFLKRPKTFEVKKDANETSKNADLDAETNPLFRVESPKHGIRAEAIEVDGEFVVLAGSIGANREKQSFHDRIKSIRDEAMESGRISVLTGGKFKVEQDINFSSPSAAAVFLFGTSRNGRTDWIHLSSGQSYGVWKDNKIDAGLTLLPQ
ncbi:GIY-YIG nuclease family protein [Mameliella sediminis]|uniref:GIY-YIG nuclease family protein n=1 Tax=Mameliella sediminis TaxID=2836866 RepID=UPI001C443A3C|nr:GIY-YIG nuclease family protein [Mameliella sediminis]MBV7394632.1 GIY-YIG nuclease family protein [Mameliella sediminis]